MIVNHVGICLSALLLEAAPRSPLVVVCHGFTGTKEGGERALAMGEELAAHGWSTLLFDFSGNGESEGAFEDISLSSHVSDLTAVIEWCRLQGFEQIVLNGRSFGGSSALLYTARDRQITALSTWAAVARPLELFGPYLENSLSGSPSDKVIMNRGDHQITLKRFFFQDLRRHDLLRSASAIAPRPYLVIHGSEDETVPPTAARELFRAAQPPKELALIEGADHRFSGHMDQVWAIFFRWLGSLHPGNKEGTVLDH